MSLKSFAQSAAVAATAFFSLSTVALADGHGDHSEQSTVLEGIPSGKYSVDLTHASVVWKVSHFGFSTYVGRFNDFTADIDLNVEDFAKSSVDVDIKVNSIDTAYPNPEKEDFDKKLSESWLKSGDAPSITFKSTEVSALNGKNFTIKGEMSMAGQTHSITLDAKINGSTPSHPFVKKPLVGFSATGTIDRTKWGVSKYAPKVGADVAIEIQGEFIKAD